MGESKGKLGMRWAKENSVIEFDAVRLQMETSLRFMEAALKGLLAREDVSTDEEYCASVCRVAKRFADGCMQELDRHTGEEG